MPPTENAPRPAARDGAEAPVRSCDDGIPLPSPLVKEERAAGVATLVPDADTAIACAREVDLRLDHPASSTREHH